MSSVKIEAFQSNKNLNKNSKNFNCTLLVQRNIDTDIITEYITISKDIYDNFEEDPYDSLMLYNQGLRCFKSI